MKDDYGQPIIPAHTLKRILGRRHLKETHASAADNFFPYQSGKISTPSGDILISISSRIEEDDNDEQWDYRSLTITVEYDPRKPYSRYRAGRLAFLVQEALVQARHDMFDAMEWHERANAMEIFFNQGKLYPTPPKGHLPGLYKQSAPWDRGFYPIPRQR